MSFPNSFVTDLKSGNSSQLTNNVDANPWYHQLKNERIQFTRCNSFASLAA